jgi:hypothetical protein
MHEPIDNAPANVKGSAEPNGCNCSCICSGVSAAGEEPAAENLYAQNQSRDYLGEYLIIHGDPESPPTPSP